MDRQEILRRAIRIHDEQGCNCDRKYLMSCVNLAAAVLRTNETGIPAVRILSVPEEENHAHSSG